MKRKIWIAVVLAVILAAGCGKSGTDTTSSDSSESVSEESEKKGTSEEETQNDDSSETEEETEGDAATHYIRDIYADQISRYDTALSEQWEEEQYYEEDMSALAASFYEGNPLENVGFALMDLGNDGYYELLIGAINGADQDPVLFEVWTVEDGKPVKLCTSGSRNRYYLCYMEEDDLYLIANEGANGAANSADHYYRMDGTKMAVVQGVVFDAEADEEHPWFLSGDDDWDISNDTPVDEKMAQDIIDSYRNSYIIPEYIPYSSYK